MGALAARAAPRHWPLACYRHLACAAVAAVCLLHGAGWLEWPLMRRIEHIFYDFRLRATLANSHDPRIAIVTINEDSLAQEGRWPWSREKMAYLVDMLFDYYGIRMLGFDMVFAEPDTSSGLGLLTELAAGPLRGDRAFLEVYGQLRPRLAYDQVFAASLAGRPVVLGYFFSHFQEKKPQVGQLPPALAQADGLPFADYLYHAHSHVANLPPLQAAAGAAGFFNNPSIDADGVYRRLPLLARHQGQVFAALPLAMLMELLGNPAIEFGVGEGYGRGGAGRRLEHILIEGFSVPVDEHGAVLIPYRGKQGSFSYFSAADVLNGVVDRARLNGKIVIFGTTATALADFRATPVQSVYPGVEIHANILSALLDQSLKSRPGYLLAVETLQLLVIALLATALFPRLPPLRLAAAFVVLQALQIGGNLYCWQRQGLDMALANPSLLLSLLFGIHLFFGFFHESRRKQHLSRLFGQYVPPQLVAEMSRSCEEFSLRGESRQMTVLFADIRGFTRIAEGMDPEALCALINAVLTPVTAAIHNTRGTIDKYIGDAVMAFWGAPQHNPRHAHDAVSAALAIIAVLREVNRQCAARGWPPIGMGIGVSSGLMNVGNMGSKFRIAYTVMGDAVNLGARLEGLTKHYGANIIVSEATRHAAPAFAYRELDRVRVKGKQEAVSLYEPVAEHSHLSAPQLDAIYLLQHGLCCYRQRQWPQAEEIFKALAHAHPGDKLYTLYLRRIARHRLTPPAADWDGVFTHTRK